MYFKNKQANKIIGTEIRFVATRGKGKEGELHEGSQNIQTFSNTIHKYWGCNVQDNVHHVMYNVMTLVDTAVWHI